MRVIVRRGPFHFYGFSALALWAVGRLLSLALWLVVVALGRPRATLSAVAVVAVVWSVLTHPLPTVAVAGALLEAGHLWSVTHPRSWHRHVVPRLRASWRALWVYRRRWRTAMRVAELERDGRLPRLRRVQCTATTDLVHVRGLLGQRFTDWEEAGPMLAHVFGTTGVVVHRGDDRRLTLELVRGDVGRSWNRDGYLLGAEQQNDPAP